VQAAGLPPGALSIVAGAGREELAELATQTGVVDLIIPRGGEGLKAALKGVATVPVIYAASGNCHVFVDATADLEGKRSTAMTVPARPLPGSRWTPPPTRTGTPSTSRSSLRSVWSTRWVRRSSTSTRTAAVTPRPS
jgi:hypothetical protein